jgi:hypothetical protein
MALYRDTTLSLTNRIIIQSSSLALKELQMMTLENENEKDIHSNQRDVVLILFKIKEKRGLIIFIQSGFFVSNAERLMNSNSSNKNIIGIV